MRAFVFLLVGCLFAATALLFTAGAPVPGVLALGLCGGTLVLAFDRNLWEGRR